MRRMRWLGLLLVAFTVAGCGTLEKKIQENLDAAAQLAQRCDAFEQDTPDIAARDLVERVRARLLLSCAAEPGRACPFGLQEQIRDARSTWFRDNRVPAGFDSAMAAFSASLSRFDAIVREMLTVERLPDLERTWQEAQVQCRAVPQGLECSRALARVVGTLATAANTASGDGRTLLAALGETLEAWRRVAAIVEGARPQLTEAGAQAARLAEGILRSASDSASAIASVAVQEFRAYFFDRLLPTVTAQKVLDFTERQLEPVDRLIDKADQKIYMLGSFAVEVNRAPIQKEFDRFYIRYVRDRFPSTSMAVAFARAACARLGSPTPAGRPASIITPFLFSSLTLIELEVRSKGRCMGPPRAEELRADRAAREQQCERKTAELRKAAFDQLVSPAAPPVSTDSPLLQAFAAQGTNLPSPPASAGTRLDPPAPPAPGDVFQTCLAGERSWRAKLASAGEQPGSADARRAAQSICGEYLLQQEQERYSAAAGATTATPPTVDAGKLASAMEQLTLALGQERSARAPAAPEVAAAPPPSLCDRLRAALGAIRCVQHRDGEWIELPELFASAHIEAAALVPALRTLALAVDAYAPAGTAVTVYGGASQAPVTAPSLRQALARAPQFRCAASAPAATALDASNRKLAELRADWAARVMHAAAPALGPRLQACVIAATPEHGDQAFDRRVVVRLQRPPSVEARNAGSP